MVPLINGRAYDFAQIRVTMFGNIVPSISAVEYMEEQEKENNFGAGDRPVSRGAGAINSSGKLTISMNDVEAIRAATVDGSLLNIPAFDVTVTYLHPTASKVVSHILKNCEFINDGVTTAQGDKDVKRDFDIVISHIIWK